LKRLPWSGKQIAKAQWRKDTGIAPDAVLGQGSLFRLGIPKSNQIRYPMFLKQGPV
jgi:hypothetical protein